MPKIKVDSERCKGCGLCILYCPKGSIVLSDKLNKKGIRVAKVKDKNTCTGCSFCAIICPDSCIEVFK